MIGLLEIVDEVIVYRDLDQSTVLESLKPAMFVHPPDYGNLEDHMKTISTARRIGAEVVAAERTKGVSTTELLRGFDGT
jgi:glycerol-3-phosphate cytidylyltransferase-like family protein